MTRPRGHGLRQRAEAARADAATRPTTPSSFRRAPTTTASMSGTMPDCTLLGFSGTCTLRGKAFEYDVVHANGAVETLLRLNRCRFHWQRYQLTSTPLRPASCKRWRGMTTPKMTARSRPQCRSTLGGRTYEEMMVGLVRRGRACECGQGTVLCPPVNGTMTVNASQEYLRQFHGCRRP